MSKVTMEDVKEVKPKEMVLTATVALINRAAEAVGVNAKMNRPTKSLLKFRNRSFGPAFIQVATLKDTFGPKFDVDKITNIRTTFISEGKMTIETDQTTIMVRNADPEELQNLFRSLELAKKVEKAAPATSAVTNITEDLRKLAEVYQALPVPSPSSSSACPENPRSTSSRTGVIERNQRKFRNQNTVSRPKPVTKRRTVSKSKSTSESAPLRQSSLNFKPISAEERDILMLNNLTERRRRNPGKRARSRSPSPTSLSKVENAKVRKTLQSYKTRDMKILKINIWNKQQYFEEFSSKLVDLNVTGIALRKVDSRLLALQNLKILDLSENSLTNVDALRQLNSTLQTLKLDSNKIKSLDSRLLYKWQNLSMLNLRENLLESLPDSFVFLQKLLHLDVSHNQLKVLPYNMHFMASLRTLLVNNNLLNAVPQSLAMRYGSRYNGLAKIDISNNSRELYKELKDERGIPITPITRGFGTLEPDQVPSLMELAAEAIFKHSARKPKEAFYKWENGSIPWTLMEYLFRGKTCATCLRTVMRYSYITLQGKTRDLAPDWIGDGTVLNMQYSICYQHITHSK